MAAALEQQLRVLAPGELEYVTQAYFVGEPFAPPSGYDKAPQEMIPYPGGRVVVTWKRVGRRPMDKLEGLERSCCNALTADRMTRCTLEPGHEPPHQAYEYDYKRERWHGPPDGEPFDEWEGDERENCLEWCARYEPEFVSVAPAAQS